MNESTTSASLDPAPEQDIDDFKAMMIGAAIIVVLSYIPYVRMGCCLLHWVGTLVAVHLFTQQYRLTLSYGGGIRLGVLTCLLGGYAAWIIGVALWLIFGTQVGAEEGRALGLFLAEKLGGAEALEAAKQQMEAQQSQGITLGQVLIGAVSVGVIAAISGVIGGAVGAALFRRGPKPEAADAR
jgi:hypothetical protein